MGWHQAATGRVAAVFFGGKSLQSHPRGASLTRWRRSRAPEAAHLGMIGQPLQVGGRLEVPGGVGLRQMFDGPVREALGELVSYLLAQSGIVRDRSGAEGEDAAQIV